MDKKKLSDQTSDLNILILDDEKNIREGLKKALSPAGYNIFLASDAEEALSIIYSEKIYLGIFDIQLPKMSGLELFHKLLKSEDTFPIIFITGHGTVEMAVNAMRDGAFDFMTKPIDLEKLELIIAKALRINKRINKIEKEKNRLMLQVKSFEIEKLILGNSVAIKKLLDTIKLIAPSKGNVYIYGESGTGKELVCNAIHHYAGGNKPLVKVNCAALTSTLLESELFGHVKGAFTGADRDKVGRFEQANGGTIFIDEVSEIPLHTQVKLLRVIQEKELERVGSGKSIKIDIRVISASNKDLKKEVDQGKFREDLFYRLNVLDIVVPPLREREGDVELLSRNFFNFFFRENQKQAEVSSKVYMALKKYHWPGNIRELRNVIEKTVVLARGSEITIADLPEVIKAKNGNYDKYEIPFGLTMKQIERKVINDTISYYNGNKSKAASQLNIGRKKIYSFLDKE